MSHYYVDSSALVKRYCPEIGSVWVKSLMTPSAGYVITFSELTLAEVAAAIAAKARAPYPQNISLAERDKVLADFLTHCAKQYILFAVERSIVDQAVRLTQRHRLRGYDAIHLATALAINAGLLKNKLPHLAFLSADTDLLKAASSEGLATDNPNQHP